MAHEYQPETGTYHVACDVAGCKTAFDTECRYWDIALDVLRDNGWVVEQVPEERLYGLTCWEHGAPSDTSR